jgi:protein CpxP
MFKKLALSALLLSIGSISLHAQQTTTDAPAQTTNQTGRNRSMQQRPMADPQTRARRMTDRMTKQLGLDGATSQKVYDATLVHAQKVDAIMANSDDKKAKAQAMKANADDFKSKLQGVLTPDQFAKVQAMRGKMRHGRGRPDDTQEGSDRK